MGKSMVGERFSQSWRTENTKTVMDDTMELLDLDDISRSHSCCVTCRRVASLDEYDSRDEGQK